MTKVLLAGATGYLGNYILSELIKNHIATTIIVRHPDKISLDLEAKKLVSPYKADLTQPDSIVDCCEGVDTVISTVGITKPKDGLTYMQVDYQANLNLLKEAKKSGVRKFIYISIFKGDGLKDIAICNAKEKFVSVLKSSGIEYCIIRPTGYFSDMGEIYHLARKGRVYLFKKGTNKINPISGQDLATECVKAIHGTQTQINIGGPQTLTFTEVAKTAFKVLDKKPKITYIPDWIRKVLLRLAKIFLNEQNYGPIEFFMTVMVTDMNAPEHGKYLLEDYFKALNSRPH